VIDLAKPSLGIVGFGRFGELCARELAPYFDVSVSNRSDKRQQAEALGVTYATADECAQKEYVLFCVPISEFESSLRQSAPHFQKGALVMDTCSIKEEPAKALEKHVPDRCECIATHPQFGPDTAKNGLAGLRVTLCPVRASEARITKLTDFLSALRLNVVRETPEEHDRKAANTQALSHFLGRGLFGCGILSLPDTDSNSKILKQVATIAINDTNNLFVDLQTRNRFAAEARAGFIDSLKEVHARIPALPERNAAGPGGHGALGKSGEAKMRALCEAVALALNKRDIQNQKATTRTAEFLQQVARSADGCHRNGLSGAEARSAVSELIDKLTLVDRDLVRRTATEKPKRCRNAV